MDLTVFFVLSLVSTLSFLKPFHIVHISCMISLFRIQRSLVEERYEDEEEEQSRQEDEEEEDSKERRRKGPRGRTDEEYGGQRPQSLGNHAKDFHQQTQTRGLPKQAFIVNA